MTALAVVAAVSAPLVSAIGANGGRWLPKISLPMIPVAAAVLPNGKVLVWSSDLVDGYGSADGKTLTAILDPKTETVASYTVANTDHNMFCPGTSLLPDGKLMVNGGANDYQTSIFDPQTLSWSTGAQMKIPRAYNADATLSDGRVFTIGGSWSGGRGGKNGEVWSQSSGWTLLPGADVNAILTADPEGVYRSDNQAWLFALGKGIVFHAGPSKQMNFFNVAGSGSVRSAGYRGSDDHAMNGFAAMYAPGKILATGGATAYVGRESTGNANIITLDTTNFNVLGVEKVASLKYPRSFHNGVVLPDGDVLILGGQRLPKIWVDETSTDIPELWDRMTKTFRSLKPSPIARTYHSVGLLLPDGRVFSGGGGLCNVPPGQFDYCPKYPDGSNAVKNHLDGNIFVPPYLLNEDGSYAKRPVIKSAPTSAVLGATITVTTGGPVRTFSLVRMSAATHSVNNDQRRIPLIPVRVGTSLAYKMTIPANEGSAIPGNYMLFALNAQGVPSVSHIMKIGP